MTNDKPGPQGVIAIMTAPDGRVVATHADFEPSGMGGLELWQAQRYRAQQQVKWAAVRAYCSPVVANAIDRYLSSRIADDLCSKQGGHRIVCRAVGYPDDIAAEVARG